MNEESSVSSSGPNAGGPTGRPGADEAVARQNADRRLQWFGAVMFGWGAILFAELFHLQVLRHADYVEKARNQQEGTVDIDAPRGSIYDRTGQLLAESLPLQAVFVDPLTAPDVAPEILAGELNLNAAELRSKLQNYQSNGKGYMVVEHRVPPETVERLRSLNLNWIRFGPENKRNYPRHVLASQVLGAVNSEEGGNNGIELSMDDDLRGLPGTMRILKDARDQPIDSRVEVAPRPGTSFTLSIDERIQFVAEREIARAVEQSHAESGSVVVMLPATGEILALASAPTYDPNLAPTKDEPKNARVNHAVTVPFEPGSVFKVITLSAALETTDLRPDSLINCGNGSITLFGRTIHEAHGGYGIMPMSWVLAKSSNIGAIQIGMRVGAANMYDYVRRFGFGSRTGVELPAESPGMVRKLASWGATSLSSIAMGHEIGVTTIQLARACSAVANGGFLVKPHLILRKGDQPVPVAAPVSILKPETAILMRQMMEGVVLFGTGRRYAKLQGYSSAGKTGSAQIYDFATHHYTHIYNASFMGFAPVANPAIVVVASVNGTHGGSAGYGGPVAGPVFSAVAQEALRVLDVPRDLPETQPEAAPPTQVAAADANADSDAAIGDLADDRPNILEEMEDGSAPPVSTAKANTAQPAGQAVAAAKPAAPAGSVVPNFRGLSKRAVAALAESKGYRVVLVGTGVARLQRPRPGFPLHQGGRVRVEFVR